MKTVDLNSWLDFEAAVRDLERRQQELELETRRSFDAPLFRGLGSSNWGLQTTLERSYPLEASEARVSLCEYYTDVYASKSVVETFTERQWDGLPDPPDFTQLLADFVTLGDQLVSTIRQVHAGAGPIPPEVGRKLADRVSRPQLTARELEVLRLIAEGLRNKEIANRKIAKSVEATLGSGPPVSLSVLKQVEHHITGESVCPSQLIDRTIVKVDQTLTAGSNPQTAVAIRQESSSITFH